MSYYCVLKADPQSGSVHLDRGGANPHYIIEAMAGAERFEVAINIESRDGSEVLYVIEDPFTPPDAAGLMALPAAVVPLNSEPGGLALDYVREQVNGRAMVDRSTMQLLPVNLAPADPANPLHNAVVDLLNQAVADPDGMVYAFGQSFADAGRTDGVHNIHMNQGNPIGRFSGENGTWRDGALFLNLPAQNRWTAIFIAFQTESWNTDGQGNPA